MEALAAISTPPPNLRRAAVAAAVAAQFGLRGDLDPLVSERDQNFCLRAPGGARFLVKVSSALEAAATTAFHVRVLLHLEAESTIATPRIVRTLTGEPCGRIECGARRLPLRVLSWVEGRQLEARGIDARMAARFGAALGQLDGALAGYAYSDGNPVLLWDLQRVGELRPLLCHVEKGAARVAVTAAIDDFETRVLPVQASLPRQVIHADANPENLLSHDGAIGFIDFSDMVHAPRVFDPAIAASYLRPAGAASLELIGPFIAAYHAANPLTESEIAVLFDLVRARLATSITLLCWRLGDRPPGDAYRQKSLATERTASQFLGALDALGRKRFTNKIRRLAIQPGD